MHLNSSRISARNYACLVKPVLRGEHKYACHLMGAMSGFRGGGPHHRPPVVCTFAWCRAK